MSQGAEDSADGGMPQSQEDHLALANRGYGQGEDGQWGYESSTTTTVQRTMQHRTHKTISTEVCLIPDSKAAHASIRSMSHLVDRRSICC